MRVGVVGLGSMGLRHVKNLLALGCEVGGHDPDLKACQRANAAGARANANALGLVGLPFDALVIATPAEQHLGWAQLAITHGLPVFVEKPLGTLDQLPAWRKLVQEASGLVTQVGYQLRFHESMKVFRAAAPGYESHFDVQWDGSKYPDDLITSSHEIDLVLWMGGPTRVLESVVYRPPYWSLCFSGDCEVHINARSDRYKREWWIGGAANVGLDYYDPDELGQGMYRAELEHFLACVQAGKQTECPWSDGLRVLEVCAQAVDMARQPA